MYFITKFRVFWCINGFGKYFITFWNLPRTCLQCLWFITKIRVKKWRLSTSVFIPVLTHQIYHFYITPFQPLFRYQWILPMSSPFETCQKTSFILPFLNPCLGINGFCKFHHQNQSAKMEIVNLGFHCCFDTSKLSFLQYINSTHV